MKYKKYLFMIFLLIMILLSMASSVRSNKTPSYVGINEGNTLIWNTNFDKDPLEEYYKHNYYSEIETELMTDNLFNYFDINADATKLKINILEIKDQKDYDYGDENMKKIPYIYEFYEYDGEWELINDYKREFIYKYNEKYYLDKTGWDMGFFSFIIANNVEWRDLIDELNENLEEIEEEGEVKEERSYFFFALDYCGISTRWAPEETGRMEKFKSKARYSDEGILLYYQWTYDEKIIFELELEGRFIVENSLYILYTLILICVALIGVCIVIAKRKKSKEKSTVTLLDSIREKVKTPLIEDETLSNEIFDKKKHCNSCGTQNSITNKFCENCGTALIEQKF